MASATVLGSGSVGPDDSAISFPAGTSLTASVNFVAAPAAAASLPPFTAERCRRTIFISSIDAPHVTNARCTACTSARVSRASSGISTSAEPPPDKRKITTVLASHFFSNSNTAFPASRLAAFGIGCPPTKYFIPGIGRAGAVGAEATPSKNFTPAGNNCSSPSSIPCAAFPIATTSTRGNLLKSISTPPHCQQFPERCSFRCIAAGISIAANVS